MNHPLTDEICREEIAESMIDFPNRFPDAHDHMRAGADWQLEQVINWIKRNGQDYFGLDVFITSDEFIADLKKAMRPQQQENN